MPTAKQKKLREQREIAKRRRLHGKTTSRRVRPVEQKHVDQTSTYIEDLEPVAMALPDGRYIPANPPSMRTLVDDVVPARAKCPVCNFSHKVRKDGTMSRHDVYYGDQPTQCEGTGQPWNAAASPA